VTLRSKPGWQRVRGLNPSFNLERALIYFSKYLISSHFRVRLFCVAAFVAPIARVAIDPNDIRLVLRIDCLAQERG
jgi:hypothetical protein